jgi:hypothetical protein
MNQFHKPGDEKRTPVIIAPELHDSWLSANPDQAADMMNWDHMPELRDFIVANIIKGKTWVGDFLDSTADENYQMYLKRKESFTYIFSEEINVLFEDTPLVFTCRGQHPIILNKYLSGEISLETLAVLNEFFFFYDKFDRELGEDDIIWSKVRLLVKKIIPFLSYDREKILAVLKKRLINTHTE